MMTSAEVMMTALCLTGTFVNAQRQPLMPILKETLFHQEWEVKESGILALGQ